MPITIAMTTTTTTREGGRGMVVGRERQRRRFCRIFVNLFCFIGAYTTAMLDLRKKRNQAGDGHDFFCIMYQNVLYFPCPSFRFFALAGGGFP